MTSGPNIFDTTRQEYLRRIGETDLREIAQKIGATYVKNTLIAPLVTRNYMISPKAVTDEQDREAPFPVCVLLSRYILHCPAFPSGNTNWTAFRDFPGTSPLLCYFTGEIEDALAKFFANGLPLLQKCCTDLGGRIAEPAVHYDLGCAFTALPKLRLLLLFNDADEEFPAAATLLFEKMAGDYLDPESLAILARHLYERLQEIAGMQIA